MKCIYAIINLKNGKKYIGSTSNFARRKCKHLYALKRNIHHSGRLQNSWNKHGEENFAFIILKHLEKEDDMYEIEQIYLNKYKSFDKNIGYNMCQYANAPIGQNGLVRKVYQYDFYGNLICVFNNCINASDIVGCDPSGLSKCARGKFRFYSGFVWIYEEDNNLENIQKRCEIARNPLVFTEQRKQKIGNFKRGTKLSEETKKKCSESHKGKCPSNLKNLHEKEKIKVYVYDLDNNFIREFESITKCNTFYGIKESGIYNKHKKYKHLYWFSSEKLIIK